MSEQHIPVIPNINHPGAATPKKKARRDIFEGDKDPDVQQVLRKKVDILDLDTQKTSEEKNAKKDDGSLSWIIIALVIVVIILLIAVTYYILMKNEKKESIPPDVVRPIQQMSHIANQIYQSKSQHPHPTSQNSQFQDPQFQDPKLQNSQKPKSKYMEPTDEELDAALQRAQNKKGDVSPEVNHTEERNNRDSRDDNDRAEENTPDANEDIFINENIKNLILDEDMMDGDEGNMNFINPSEIDEFHRQVIADEE